MSALGVSVADDRPLALTVGCTLGFETPQPVSAVLQIAPSGRDLEVRAERWDGDADHHSYIDLFGNRCERVTIAAGASRIAYEAEVVLSSPGDRVAPGTAETPIMALPDEHIAFVMPSRFCLPDELGHEAWQRFGDLAPGWQRVQAIVDFVHGHLEWVAGASTLDDGGRRLPGRPGRLPRLRAPGDHVLPRAEHPGTLRVRLHPRPRRPASAEPMDFAAWLEVYLDGAWHTFDARNNRRRVGRVVVGRGRDAVDVALLTSFGHITLTEFEVRAG